MDGLLQLPQELLERYQLVEQIELSSERGHRYFRLRSVHVTEPNREFFAKVSPLDALDAAVEELIRERSQGTVIHRSIQTFADESSFYLISPYRPLGSFRSYMGAEGVSLEVFTDVIRQLNEALRDLHENCQLVHCDIKPSNILIRALNSGRVDLELTDFGNATEISIEHRRARGFTLRYAAPEIIIPNVPVTAAADYWSLGALLYEWVTGAYMFKGVADEMIYRRLPSFQPDLSGIETTEIRALIGGLLQADSEIRFGAYELDLWLEGKPEIISDGLNLSGESAASVPLALGRHSVYSPAGLAQALLEINNPALLQDTALLDWVEQDLGRGDVAATIRASDATEEDAQLRLLLACFYLWPQMPPVWHGQKLSTEVLSAYCRDAIGGDADSRNWLWSLWSNSDALDFYASRASRNALFLPVSESILSVRKAMQATDQAWTELETLGAPAEMRQSDEQELPLVILAVLDSDYAAKIQKRALHIFRPDTLLFRADWFYTFGTGEGISLEQLLVLEQLDEVARLQSVPVSSPEQMADLDDESLQAGVIFYETQRILASGMMVKPGTTIASFRDGGVFNPTGRGSLGQYLREQIWQPIQASFAWIVGELRRMLSEGEVNPGEEESLDEETSEVELDEMSRPFYDAYLLPIVPAPVPMVADDTCVTYLVRISWRATEGRSVQMALQTPGRIFRRRLLKLSNLPWRGHMLLCVEKESVLTLREKTGYITSFKYPPLHLRLQERREGLTKVRSGNYPKVPDLIAADTTIGDFAVQRETPIPGPLRPVTGCLGGSTTLTPVDAELRGAADLRDVSMNWLPPAISDREYRKILQYVQKKRSKRSSGV